MGALPPMPMGEEGQTMGSLVPPQEAPVVDVQEQARAVMNQIRQLMMTMDTLASQFPVAAQPLQIAGKALQQALISIISDVNRTQTTPPTPRTL